MSVSTDIRVWSFRELWTIALPLTDSPSVSAKACLAFFVSDYEPRADISYCEFCGCYITIRGCASRVEPSKKRYPVRTLPPLFISLPFVLPKSLHSSNEPLICYSPWARWEFFSQSVPILKQTLGSFSVFLQKTLALTVGICSWSVNADWTA